jgi:hypothetical protein
MLQWQESYRVLSDALARLSGLLDISSPTGAGAA